MYYSFWVPPVKTVISLIRQTPEYCGFNSLCPEGVKTSKTSIQINQVNLFINQRKRQKMQYKTTAHRI